MTKAAKGKDKKPTASASGGGNVTGAGPGKNKFRVDDKVFAMDGGDLYEAKVCIGQLLKRHPLPLRYNQP